MERIAMLSEAEIRNLTGFIRPSAQKRWLRQYQIPFFVGGDGYVKVLCENVRNANNPAEIVSTVRALRPQLRFEH
jgi:hypothetical protein